MKSAINSLIIWVITTGAFVNFSHKCKVVQYSKSSSGSSPSLVSLLETPLWKSSSPIIRLRSQLFYHTLIAGGLLLQTVISGNPVNPISEVSRIEVPTGPANESTAEISVPFQDKYDMDTFDYKDGDTTDNNPIRIVRLDPVPRGNGAVNQMRNARLRKNKDRLRIELLKQIKSLDHMKCFPKVLCGLSVDSSQSDTGIDAHFIRSYIQLMRAAKPEDDSSEESKPLADRTKDSLSRFLMRSGIIRTKKHKSEEDDSLSDEAEEDDQPKQSTFQKNYEALQKLVQKRKLALDDQLGSLNMTDAMLKDYQRLSESSNNYHHPIVFMTGGNTNSAGPPATTDEESISSQLGSLVSSWVPWVSLSFGTDSFEKDPFFTGKKPKGQKKAEMRERALDKEERTYRLRQNGRRSDGKEKKTRDTRREAKRSDKEDEMAIYSTAVEMGQKLQDTRQCDYLYNGCPVPYSDIIKMISFIRKDIKVDDETKEMLSKEIFNTDSNKRSRSKSKQSVTSLNRQTGSNSNIGLKSKKNSNKNHPSSYSISSGDSKRKNSQNPMTRISHILPNGEKVEINVQVSGKNEAMEDEDAGLSQEEGLRFEDQSYTTQNEEEGIIFKTGELEQDETAISASYELDDEILDEFRKPSPLEIFNKISLKVTPKPLPRPANGFNVNNEHVFHKEISENKGSSSSNPSSISANPPPLSFTKNLPPSELKRTASTTFKPKRYTSSSSSSGATGSSTKPGGNVNAATDSDSIAKRGNVKMNTSTKKPLLNSSSGSRTTTTTSRKPPTSRPSQKPPATLNSTGSKSTYVRHQTPLSPTKGQSSFSNSLSQKGHKKSPKPTSENRPKKNSSMNETEITTGIKRPKEPQFQMTSTTTTIKPILPALAMFTTTQSSVYDKEEVIYQVGVDGKRKNPNTFSLRKPYPSISPTNRYSVKKPKPGSWEVETSDGGGYDSDIKVLMSKGSSSTESSQISTYSSVEVDSTEIVKVFPTPEVNHDDVINIPGDDWVPLVTTETQPKWSEISGNSNKSPESSYSKEQSESSNSAKNGKRRIQYKNPKLPQLVILNSSTLDHPNPIVMSAEQPHKSTLGNSRRPDAQSKAGNRRPTYSLPSSKKTATKPTPGYPQPHVFLSDSEEFPYWVPNL